MVEASPQLREAATRWAKTKGLQPGQRTPIFHSQAFADLLTPFFGRFAI
jgi:hypothetical protein